MDWNWFFSSLAQSVAALVGVFSAFVITKIVNNQSEFSSKVARTQELLDKSLKYKEAASHTCKRSFTLFRAFTRYQYQGFLSPIVRL